MPKIKLPPIQNIELENVKNRQEKIQKRKKVVRKTDLDLPLRDRLGRNPAKYLKTEEDEKNIYGFTDDPSLGRFYNSHTPQYRVNVVEDDNESMDIDNEDTNFTAEFSNNKRFSNGYTPFDAPFVPDFTENFEDNYVDMNINDRTFNNFERETKKKRKRVDNVKEKPNKKMKETVSKKRKRTDDDTKPKKKTKTRKPRLEPIEILID